MVEKKKSVLDYCHEIEIQKPSDIILEQLKSLVASGVLKPGDILPSERELSIRFGVGRGHVREAIKKLEFYGILKTLPQNGTYVASLGVKSLEGIISNVLNLEKQDFKSLLETRSLLEIQAARFTALRISDDEIQVLEKAQTEFRAEVESGKSGLDYDLAFHLKIAAYCQNSVLRSLIALITPDIVKFSKNLDTCSEGRFYKALEEHELILEAIRNKDENKAALAMENHLKRTLEVTQEAYNKKLNSNIATN